VIVVLLLRGLACRHCPVRAESGPGERSCRADSAYEVGTVSRASMYRVAPLLAGFGDDTEFITVFGA